MSIECREAAGAIALTLTRTEPWTWAGKFTSRFTPMNLHRAMSIEEATKSAYDPAFSTTDCAQPIQYALDNNLEADVFVILTDNETYAGSIHPSKALEKYRQKTGIPAKLAVFGMTATNFSIADPNDRGMMDFVGFDSSAPAMLSDFARG